MQDIARAFLQGQEDHPDDSQSSTTWYESAAFDSASARSHDITTLGRADSLSAPDEFASPRSTGSFVSATGSFHSQTSFRTTNSHLSTTGGYTPGAASSAVVEPVAVPAPQGLSPPGQVQPVTAPSAAATGSVLAAHGVRVDAAGPGQGTQNGPGAETVLQSALYRSGSAAQAPQAF